MRFRLISWNINSLRKRLEPLHDLVRETSPDVICLQETKVADALFPHAEIAAMGYAHRATSGFKGYNGVAILSRLELESARGRQWCGRADGRHVQARLGGGHGGIELHNFYVPAGGDDPDPDLNAKFAHKLQFMQEMADWGASLERRDARRILVGDLNVAPLETDVWSHRQLLNVVSHTPVEVEHLDRAQAAHGWIDAVRAFVAPEVPLYSWWSYRAQDWRASNRGRRLDHAWVTPALLPALTGALVLDEVRGWDTPSDHAPVLLDFEV